MTLSSYIPITLVGSFSTLAHALKILLIFFHCRSNPPSQQKVRIIQLRIKASSFLCFFSRKSCRPLQEKNMFSQWWLRYARMIKFAEERGKVN